MRGELKHRIAYALFPRYSLLLDQINNNALVGAWIKKNHSLPSFSSRYKLYEFVNASELSDGDVDYLEFGVYRGESIRHWASINHGSGSRFWGFDSFEGLPESWGSIMQAGAFDVQGQTPRIDDARVNFVKGWFQDSLPRFLQDFSVRSRLVVHLDCDLHSSALYCLTKMDPIIVSGTILLFDEFSSALHEFRALAEYCQAYRRRVRPLAMTSHFADQVAFVVE